MEEESNPPLNSARTGESERSLRSTGFNKGAAGGSVLRNRHHCGTGVSGGDRNSSTRWSSISEDLYAQWTKAPRSGFLCRGSNRRRGRTKTSQRCILHRVRSFSLRNGRADREWCSISAGARQAHSKVREHQLDPWPKARSCRLGPRRREAQSPMILWKLLVAHRSYAAATIKTSLESTDQPEFSSPRSSRRLSRRPSQVRTVLFERRYG